MNNYKVNFHNYTLKMQKIAIEKNSDYSGFSQNALANFYRVEELNIATVGQSFLVRMSDKFSRLLSFSKKGSLLVKDESIEDTLLDWANYNILFLAYIHNFCNNSILNHQEYIQFYKDKIIELNTLKNNFNPSFLLEENTNPNYIKPFIPLLHNNLLKLNNYYQKILSVKQELQFLCLTNKHYLIFENACLQLSFDCINLACILKQQKETFIETSQKILQNTQNTKVAKTKPFYFSSDLNSKSSQNYQKAQAYKKPFSDIPLKKDPSDTFTKLEETFPTPNIGIPSDFW